jgi:hypothetical protein
MCFERDDGEEPVPGEEGSCSDGELEIGRVLGSEVLYTYAILGQYERGLGGVLAQLFGDIGVGEALVGGVIVLVARMYKASRLFCDTRRELNRVGLSSSIGEENSER